MPQKRNLLDQFLSGPKQGLESYFEALLKLQRVCLEEQPFVVEQVHAFLELFARYFEVNRVSFWYLKQNENGRYLECGALYQKDQDDFSSGLQLFEKDYPDYFHFLDDNVAFAADDVFTHPYTKAFEHVYLRPLNITSMMDAPLHVLGRVVGVICVEHVGAPRKWAESEEAALIHLSNQISTLLVTQELDRRVLARTEELRRSESEVRHLAAQLVREAKMSALGEMAGSLAHEIKNPMTVILGRAVHQLDRLKSLQVPPEEVVKTLQVIEKASNQILNVVQAMKTYTRDGSRDPLQPIPLASLIEDSLQMMSTRLEHNSFKVTTDIPKSLKVQARPAQILQILVNLLSNAIEANEESKQRWIKITCQQKPPFAEIHFLDSGHGIPKKIVERMFLPLFTTKSSHQSTGLGLSIARGIAQEHQGDLDYDANSKNTHFVLKLLLANS